MITRRRRLMSFVATALLAGGCTATVDGQGRPASDRPDGGSAAPSSTAPSGPSAGSSGPSSGSSGPSGGACPTSYAAPDPNRPRVSLAFAVSDDHSRVDGTERVSFRPDRPVSELVFRLTANTKPSVAQGNRIEVSTATATPAGGRFRVTPANADPSTQGGLLRVPLGRTVRPGETATARISFRLTLGQDSFDRFGRAGEFAYFGSGQPLLAWQRGYGWHTEDLIDITAESATSEAMDTDLTVTAPSGDVVIASGNPTAPADGPGATRIWRSRLSAARDVLVSVGPFRVSDATVGGVRLRVGAPDAAERDQLLPEFRRAITELARRFGPFPFPSLAVARVPAQGGGIEYPGSILMLDSSRLVAVHETAHEWFYAMVGNSQSQHPWLDEAFASYAQELVDDYPGHGDDLQTPGRVDSSVQSYGEDEGRYYFTTYDKGSAALEAARQATGARAWDAAIRCYVARNAWRVAVPGDVRFVLRGLPRALAVLREAGALP